MEQQKLLTPYVLVPGKFEVQNRVVMAPMSRSRGDTAAGYLATPLMATYYAQRGTAGIIVSEGVHISDKARGWYNVPGIYTPEQTESWKPVIKAAKAQGAKFVMQLWHQGRTTHSDFGAGQPWGPSAVAADADCHTPLGKKRCEVPHAMTEEDMEITIREYVVAATNAIAAGADGVELHGANGYLLDEFVRSASNQRSDKYGGSVENRARFPLRVVDAVVEAVGADRVGYRISPADG